VPYNVADKKAHYTKTSEWLPFDAVVTQYHRGGYDGIGIVLGCRLCGLDEDHCIHDGKMDPVAAQHLKMLNSYAEYSISDGVHCLAFGSLPPGGRRRGNHELYCEDRFFVVTGCKLADAPGTVEHRDAELHALHRTIFGTVGCGVQSVPKPSHEPALLHREAEEGGEPLPPVLLSDAKVIERILGDPAACLYWYGCPAGVNDSDADYVLARKLAFYTRRDVEQSVRIFKHSALAKRAKASSLRGEVDYIRYTVQRACSHQKAVWTPRRRARMSSPSIERPISVTTRRIIALNSEHPEMPPREIAQRLGISSGAVRTVLYRQRIAGRKRARRIAA
jgi:putative DNA primase/helicase